MNSSDQDRLNGALISAADGEPGWARQLLAAGAKPDAMALIMAIQCGEAEITRWYIDAGAPVNVQYQDTTPLIHAVTSGYLEVVAVLLEAGADVSLPDASGRTPLTALRTGPLARNRDAREWHAIESLLLEYSTSDRDADQDG